NVMYPRTEITVAECRPSPVLTQHERIGVEHPVKRRRIVVAVDREEIAASRLLGHVGALTDQFRDLRELVERCRVIGLQHQTSIGNETVHRRKPPADVGARYSGEKDLLLTGGWKRAAGQTLLPAGVVAPPCQATAELPAPDGPGCLLAKRKRVGEFRNLARR